MNEGLVEDWARDAENFQVRSADILAGGFGGGFSAQIPEIVTVTFVVQSNQTNIDLTVLHESLKFLAECTSKVCEKSNNGVSVSLNTHEDEHGTAGKRRRLYKCFYNQISLTAATPEGRRVNCKIFKKGKFLITGTKSVGELQRVLTAVANLIKDVCPEVIEDGEILFQEVKATMINACISTVGPSSSVFIMFYELLRVVEALVEKSVLNRSEVSTQFDPTVYSGIKMRFKESSILVFASGKMIISGKGVPTSLLEPLELIASVLRAGGRE
jgi:TATA-box binding protein (TBP) (component of TFIID and TFIIIB)